MDPGLKRFDVLLPCYPGLYHHLVGREQLYLGRAGAPCVRRIWEDASENWVASGLSLVGIAPTK